MARILLIMEIGKSMVSLIVVILILSLLETPRILRWQVISKTSSRCSPLSSGFRLINQLSPKCFMNTVIYCFTSYTIILNVLIIFRVKTFYENIVFICNCQLEIMEFDVLD